MSENNHSVIRDLLDRVSELPQIITAKKIIKTLRVEIKHQMNQRVTVDHLKRYIRSLEGKALERFLHFITGTDCLTGNPIQITFTSLSGLQRRPISHTCGSTLCQLLA